MSGSHLQRSIALNIKSNTHHHLSWGVVCLTPGPGFKSRSDNMNSWADMINKVTLSRTGAGSGYCLRIFTIITQTKTMYNSWMFQAHVVWVMSVHSAKWSGTRRTAQNVSSTKFEKNHVDGKTKRTFTVIYMNSVQQYHHTNTLCAQ